MPTVDALQMPAASSCTRQTPKEEPKPAPVVAQPMSVKPQISCSTLMPAYNGPAQVNVDGCWDFFANGSFLYYQAPNQPTGRLSIYGTSELGVNNALSMASLWKLGMDIIDGSLYRAYYVGSRLTFTTYSGMRVLWIDQKNRISFNDVATGNNLEALYKTTSWGVGPRMGVDMGWLLGKGFRLIGNIAGDVCYSSYKIRFAEYENPGTDSALTYLTLKYNEKAIRTHLQSGIGFGWGKYFLPSRPKIRWGIQDLWPHEWS